MLVRVSEQKESRIKLGVQTASTIPEFSDITSCHPTCMQSGKRANSPQCFANGPRCLLSLFLQSIVQALLALNSA